MCHFVPGVSIASRAAHKADPEKADCASPLVGLPAEGMATRHPPAAEPADGAPSARSLRARPLPPREGLFLTQPVACQVQLLLSVWLWMTADVSLPICTDAWMPAVVSCLLFPLLRSF